MTETQYTTVPDDLKAALVLKKSGLKATVTKVLPSKGLYTQIKAKVSRDGFIVYSFTADTVFHLEQVVYILKNLLSLEDSDLQNLADFLQLDRTLFDKLDKLVAVKERDSAEVTPLGDLNIDTFLLALKVSKELKDVLN